MYPQQEFINSSNRAKEAFTQGKRPLRDWTRNEILHDLFMQYGENNILLNTEVTNMLVDLETETLKDAFLSTKREWHHVEGKPIYFYSLDIEAIRKLNKKQVVEMLKKDELDRVMFNKPQLAKVKSTLWTTNKHGKQVPVTKKYVVVVYHGRCYFLNGHDDPLQKDRLEIIGSVGKIVGKNRILFDKILRVMREQHQIYI